MRASTLFATTLSSLVLVAANALAADAGVDAGPPNDDHTIYLNDCRPSGCPVSVGTPDSRLDRSDIPAPGKTLAAFSGDTSTWNAIVDCVRTALQAYDVSVVTTRPSSGDYFQVMIGGNPIDLGLAPGTGSTGDVPCSAPGSCDAYVPHELAFAFSAAFSNDPAKVCAAALDGLAGSWSIDHVVDATDVMSFNFTSGQPFFHDGEACGSDCMGGYSPFGIACSGTGGAATHPCIVNNQATQDEVQMLLALFGPALPPDLDAGTTDGGSPTSSDGGFVTSDGGATTSRADAGDADSSNDDSSGCRSVRGPSDPIALAITGVLGALLVARRRRRRL